MAQLVVKVNGREFPLTCADGQETRTRRLAQYVDSKVAEFTKTVGQVGEAGVGLDLDAGLRLHNVTKLPH